MSRLLPLILLAGLAACTSLDSAFDSASNLLSPSSGPTAASENSESAEGGAEAVEANAAPSGGEGESAGRGQGQDQGQGQGQGQGESEAAAAQAGAEQAAASQTARQETTAGETASAESGEPSGESEGEGGGEAGIDGRRVVTVPKGGGGNAELRRRLDTLFGESRSTSSAIESGIKPSEIVGTWLLEEEDGLRNCAITLTAPDKGGAVSRSTDCTGLAAQVTGWGMFGNDLLLRDADNTVRARLRRSDAGWIGFTLETGIPLVMSRSS